MRPGKKRDILYVRENWHGEEIASPMGMLRDRSLEPPKYGDKCARSQ